MSPAKEDQITMSPKERDRLAIFRQLQQKKISQVKAAELLQLSPRQIHRLLKKFRKQGDAALAHGLRGKPSNHQYSKAFRKKILQIYRKQFSGFGPTFASEKLAELCDIQVSHETLRCWLIEEKLWEKRRKVPQHRQRRPRRNCFGELVQMDTSIHDWTEGRGEPMVLITLIDDATSIVMARFYRSDNALSHMDLLKRWIEKYGRPVALYTDRHGIFEAHKKGEPDYEGETQFSRALKELEIQLIKAHSPQAKGRVERSFGTAQDRWVKELRLVKAKTVEQANEVMEKILPGHNRRFSVSAADPVDVHRSRGGYDLGAILSLQEQRVVENDYTIRYEGKVYQLHKPIYPGERKGTVVVERRLDGTMRIRFKKHYLNYEELTIKEEGKRNEAKAREREKEREKPKKKPNRPGANHPWRKGF